MRTFSTPQLKYMAAQAAWEAVGAAGEAVSDDAYCAAFQAKRDAQEALFAWVRERVSTDPGTARKFARNAAALDRLFAAVWKHPAIREKLTDACLRLAA